MQRHSVAREERCLGGSERREGMGDANPRCLTRSERPGSELGTSSTLLGMGYRRPDSPAV